MASNSARVSTSKQHKIAISETVSYQFHEAGGSTAGEGLLVSGRWYPGIRYNEQMYFGLHQKNRFVPGIPWGGQFLPGLMTRRGFFPGIAVGDSFTLGIVVAGVFMPGIVHGGNFVPGVVRDARLVPGCFTASRQFAPGRFADGVFESGLVNSGGFEEMPYEPLDPNEVRALVEEGYGLTAVRRTAPVGGLPIRGIVIGAFTDALAYLPGGLATTQGTVIGGIGRDGDVTTLDTAQRLGQYGLDIEDPNDPGKLLGNDGIVAKLEQTINDLLPGNALGHSAQSPMGALADAMAGMSEGENKLIDEFNQDWADYWNGLIGSNAGGMVVGAGETGHGLGKAAGGIGGFMSGAFVGAAKGMEVGAVFGLGGVIVGGVVGAALGGVGGLKAGAEAGGQIVDWVADALTDAWHFIFGGEDKKKGATSGPGGDGQEDDTRGAGMMLNPVKVIGPYISRRKTVIEVDHGEASAMPIVDTQKAPVRIIMTDTGAMLIVDYAALRRTIMTNPDRSVAVGLNPVTGKTVVIPGAVSWAQAYEQSKMPWWLNHVGHPTESGG